MKKVIVFMADGMEMCECLIVVDLLRRAGTEVTTASVMGRTEVRSSHGVMISADVLAEDADYESADMIILPGGTVGTAHLASSEVVKEQCLKFSKDRYIAAICAAPAVVLYPLGILDGKEATCYPGFENECVKAKMCDSPVVVSDNIITANGPATALRFALTIVANSMGDGIAQEIGSGMLHYPKVTNLYI
jgi:4-methyl-5(b-hydroxyethyl)-thiazole monophosphate biosynthesis